MSGAGTHLTAPDPAGVACATITLATAQDDAPDLDPLALAMAAADGFVLAGRRGTVAAIGAAARLSMPGGLRTETAGDVTRWLSAVATTDSLGCPASGPLAVGALPFLPGEPADLLVPAVTVVRRGAGERWVTLTGPLGAVDATVATVASGGPAPRLADVVRAAGAAGLTPLAELAGQAAGPAGPDAGLPPVLSTRAVPDGPAFEARVADALGAIASGLVDKVVLARQVRATFDGPVDAALVLARLRSLEPSCAAFACREGSSVFLGASPELLVRRRGRRVVSHPLAGTSNPDGAAVAALVASPKEQAEHRAAAAAVADRLAVYCDTLQVPEAPSPVRLHTVAHLGSRITGVLREPPADALTLAAALHPTPAVAGVPTAEAIELIQALEASSRDRYAGPVGWVDARGDGEWLVAIRSATVDGAEAVAYGGAGIVAGSVPARELAETTAKLHTALGALGADAAAPAPA